MKKQEKEKETIYERAINTFGSKIQIIIAMEEFSELIKCCSKIIRYKESIYFRDLIQEIVDSEIMIEQLKVILCKHFDKDMVNRLFRQYKNRALSRLDIRLDKPKILKS